MFEEWFINSVNVAPVPGSFVEKAYNAGYEAGKATAERVPLTFASVVASMSAKHPNWNAYGATRESAVRLALEVINEAVTQEGKT